MSVIRIISYANAIRISFFFFQAEDGIRYYRVTGVQTCALPISLPDHLSWFGVRAAQNSLEAFLGSIGSSNSPHSAMRQASPTCPTDLPVGRATPLHRYHHSPVGLPSCVTPSLAYYQSGPRAPPDTPTSGHTGFGRLASLGSAWAFFRGYGNINPLSIDYACRPRLRSRLTL